MKITFNFLYKVNEKCQQHSIKRSESSNNINNIKVEGLYKKNIIKLITTTIKPRLIINFSECFIIIFFSSFSRTLIKKAGKIINTTELTGSLVMRVGVTEAEAKNPQTPSLFSVDLPAQGIEGDLIFSLTSDQLDRLYKANYFVAEVTLDPVTNGDLKSTDIIILKNVKVTGDFEIDLEDTGDDK